MISSQHQSASVPARKTTMDIEFMVLHQESRRLYEYNL